MNDTPKWFIATAAAAREFFRKDKDMQTFRTDVNGFKEVKNVDEDTVMDQENYTSADWEKHLSTLPKVDPPNWSATKEDVEKDLGPRLCGLPISELGSRDRASIVEWLNQPMDQLSSEEFNEKIANLKELQTEAVTNTNWKPSNPKDLMGIRKVSLCTVSGPVLYEVALGLQEGGMKYGRHNYRSEGVASSTYIDAAMRHLWEFWEGEDTDPESGVHHVSKAISTLFVLRDAILNDKCTDDRPIRPKNPEWLKAMNKEASALVDKYPQPEKPYTHKPLPER